MATLKFLLHSKKNNAPIYCYLSEGRGKFSKRKTRETINPENWNAKKGQPKNILSGTAKALKENENLKQRLSEIESFIFGAIQKPYRYRNN